MRNSVAAGGSDGSEQSSIGKGCKIVFIHRDREQKIKIENKITYMTMK
jgi:hypothetical protein